MVYDSHDGFLHSRIEAAPAVTSPKPEMPHYRGTGYIAGELPAGLVTVAGVPASRQVELRHFDTRITIKTVLSAADGTYLFDGLDSTVAFDVLGRDQLGEYAPVIVGPVYPVEP